MVKKPNKTSTMRTVWDLSPLFTADHDSAIKVAAEEARSATWSFVEKWERRNDYLKNPKVLQQALADYESWLTRFGADSRRNYYFWLRSEIDRNNTKIKAELSQARQSAQELWNSIQFFTLRLAKIPANQQAQLLQAKELRRYRYFLERLFAEAKYLLTENEEKIINHLQGSAYINWVSLTEDALAKESRLIKLAGKKQTKNFAELCSLISEQNQTVRDQAAQAINDILKQHRDTAVAEINSVLEYKKNIDDIRQVSRPDAIRHLEDDIDSQTVDRLLAVVEKNNHLAKKFYGLKAKLFGKRQIAYHERNLAWGQTTIYPLATAITIVRETLSELGGDFSEIFDNLLRHGQIDALPRLGKSDGAFCAHQLITHPSYILLNHTGTAQDVLTLAHETGHAINNEMIKTKQSAIYFATPTATAEVASTLFENLVLQKMISRETNEKKRLSLLLMKLNSDVSSIFRQVAAYRFEQTLHQHFRQTGFLSAEKIGQLFTRQMKSYLGPAVAIDPGSENWWIYWSHFRNFFYVYSYASGLLIANYLQQGIRADRHFIEPIKELLSAGTSEAPEKLFHRLGVDINSDNFWSTAVCNIAQELQEAEKLAKKFLKK